MNYNYINGLIILDSYYTSIEFKLSNSYSINKDPNNRLITINFTQGMKSSDISQYELINNIELQEDFILLDNNYITINNNIYYCKQKFDYISQYLTDFMSNNVTIKDNHIIVNITSDTTQEEYKELLSNFIITNSDNYLFNCTLIKLDKTNKELNDNQIYHKKADVYISSVDARNSFMDAVSELTGLQVVTSIDQREIEGKQLLEYFQLSDGIATPEDDLNTRIIFDPNYGRLKNNSIYFRLNYFTKDVALYERRFHESLLKNDLNRLTTFKIFDKWSASVDWIYRKLPDDLMFNELKLDNNSNSTMMYSIPFNVRILFFIVEQNINYPRILHYLVNINTGDSNNEVIG
jgi:hypothetical protein